MSFFPNMVRSRSVPGIGPKDARIAIVGDYTSAFDDNAMKPFQGSAGTVLERCLHQAGLILGEVYMTNLFKNKATKNVKYGDPAGPQPDLFNENKKQFTSEGNRAVQELLEELDAVKCNIIVTCGRAPAVALAGVRALHDRRGYVHSSIGLKNCKKVIPTLHPSNAVRGNYISRHLITHDLKKAKAESLFNELRRPERNLIYEFGSVDEVLQWIDYFNDRPALSVDIEVLNYEMSCINLSDRPDLGVVIPLTEQWSEDEEVLIWHGLAKLLGNSAIKIMQNGIFDIHFLATRCGIIVNGPLHDTMIAHSCMYPELNKGLGFLGSLYCGSQEYWKDKANFKNIKEDN